MELRGVICLAVLLLFSVNTSAQSNNNDAPNSTPPNSDSNNGGGFDMLGDLLANLGSMMGSNYLPTFSPPFGSGTGQNVSMTLAYYGPAQEFLGQIVIKPGQPIANVLSRINIKAVIQDGAIADSDDSALSSVFVYLTRPLLPQPYPGRSPLEGPDGDQLWSPETVYVGEHSLQGMKKGDAKELKFDSYSLNYQSEPALCGEAVLVWRFDPLGTSGDIGGPNRTLAINVFVNCSEIERQTGQFVEIIPDYQAGGQRAAVLVFSGGRLRKSLAYLGYPGDEWSDFYEIATPDIMSYVGRMRLLTGRERRLSKAMNGDYCLFDVSHSQLSAQDLSDLADVFEYALQQSVNNSSNRQNNQGDGKKDKPSVRRRRQSPGGLNVGLRPGQLVSGVIPTKQPNVVTNSLPTFKPQDTVLTTFPPTQPPVYNPVFSTSQPAGTPPPQVPDSSANNFGNWNYSGDFGFGFDDHDRQEAEQVWGSMADIPMELQVIIRFVRLLAAEDNRLYSGVFKRIDDANLKLQLVRVAKALSEISKRRELFIGFFGGDPAICPGRWAMKFVSFLRDMNQLITNIRFPIKDKTPSSALSNNDGAVGRALCWVKQNVDGVKNDLLTLNDGVFEWSHRFGIDKVFKSAVMQKHVEMATRIGNMANLGEMFNNLNFSLFGSDNAAGKPPTEQRAKRDAGDNIAASLNDVLNNLGYELTDTVGSGFESEPDFGGSGEMAIAPEALTDLTGNTDQTATKIALGDPCDFEIESLFDMAYPFNMFWIERNGKIFQGVRTPWTVQYDRKVNWRVVASLQCSGSCSDDLDAWEITDDPLSDLDDDGDDDDDSLQQQTTKQSNNGMTSLIRDILGITEFVGSQFGGNGGQSAPQPSQKPNIQGQANVNDDFTIDIRNQYGNGFSWQQSGQFGMGQGGDQNQMSGGINVGGFGMQANFTGSSAQMPPTNGQQPPQGGSPMGNQPMQQPNTNGNRQQQPNTNSYQRVQSSQTITYNINSQPGYGYNYYTQQQIRPSVSIGFGYQQPYYISSYRPSSPLGLLASAALMSSVPTYVQAPSYVNTVYTSYPNYVYSQPRPIVQTNYYVQPPAVQQTRYQTLTNNPYSAYQYGGSYASAAIRPQVNVGSYGNQYQPGISGLVQNSNQQRQYLNQQSGSTQNNGNAFGVYANQGGQRGSNVQGNAVGQQKPPSATSNQQASQGSIGWNVRGNTVATSGGINQQTVRTQNNIVSPNAVGKPAVATNNNKPVSSGWLSSGSSSFSAGIGAPSNGNKPAAASVNFLTGSVSSNQNKPSGRSSSVVISGPSSVNILQNKPPGLVNSNSRPASASGTLSFSSGSSNANSKPSGSVGISIGGVSSSQNKPLSGSSGSGSLTFAAGGGSSSQNKPSGVVVSNSNNRPSSISVGVSGGSGRGASASFGSSGSMPSSLSSGSRPSSSGSSGLPFGLTGSSSSSNSGRGSSIGSSSSGSRTSGSLLSSSSSGSFPSSSGSSSFSFDLTGSSSSSGRGSSIGSSSSSGSRTSSIGSSSGSSRPSSSSSSSGSRPSSSSSIFSSSSSGSRIISSGSSGSSSSGRGSSIGSSSIGSGRSSSSYSSSSSSSSSSRGSSGGRTRG